MRLRACFAVAVLAVFLFPAAASAGKLQYVLPESTLVKVKFEPATPIKSNSVKVGTTIPILLEEDVKIADVTIIERGAKGTAVVKEVVKPSRPGEPGAIVVSFVDLKPKGSYKPKGGGPIKLAKDVTIEGHGRRLLSWLFIFGLFIKGGQAEIDAALPYTAMVGEGIILESR